MLNIGFGEMLVIAALALVFIGPDELPKVMRTMGRYYGKIRRMSDDLRRAFTLEIDRADAEERAEEIRRRREEMLAKRKANQELESTRARPEQQDALRAESEAPPAGAPESPSPPATTTPDPFPREGGIAEDLDTP